MSPVAIRLQSAAATATAAAPSPAAVIARWPRTEPLVGLVSYPRAGEEGEAGVPDPDEAGTGWSMLARPSAWRTAARGSLGSGPAAVIALRQLLDPGAPSPARSPSPDASGGPVPFGSGWIAVLAYELGRSLEPTAARSAAPLEGEGGSEGEAPTPPPPSRSRDDRGWPDVLLARVTGGLAFDHAAGAWWWFGEAPEPVRRSLLGAWEAASQDEAAPDGGRGASPGSDVPASRDDTAAATIGPRERRSLDDAAHEAAVAAARAAIASGEIFQANVTRRRTRRFEGSLRRLALAAFDVARPRHGAIVEAPAGRGLVSLSPELFLACGPGPDRLAVTRPIKGTAPAPLGTTPDPAGAAGLLASQKDAAELTMIVDLMRNDLGRVAIPGGVSVSRPRHVETHATVHHAVAEVRAQLRPDVDAAALIAATFPPGSVTGAPKIRAMQVIDRLEPVRRGPYCGSIGWIGDDGSLRLNVAIRTLAVTPDAGRPRDAAGHAASGASAIAATAADHRAGHLDYASGGGIVADSDPVAERIEADVKAEVFQRTLERMRRSPADAARPSPVTTQVVATKSTPAREPA